jgi:hypothetical protein
VCDKRHEQKIHDFAGTVAGKFIRHGDVLPIFRLPAGRHRIPEVVLRIVLDVHGSHNSLSQLRVMDQGLQIVPVNGYGNKIYDQYLSDSAQGQGPTRGCGTLVGRARQIGGFFRLQVKVAGKLHRMKESRQHTAASAANEHIYREFMVLEEPKNDISCLTLTVLEYL